MPDRYHIAKQNNNINISNIEGYRFKPTSSIGQTLKYMIICFHQKKTFIANNIPESTLISAIFNFCKKENYPLLVDEKEAQKLSIAYSYNKVFHKDNFPESCNYLVTLNCMTLPPWTKPVLIIIT